MKKASGKYCVLALSICMFFSYCMPVSAQSGLPDEQVSERIEYIKNVLDEGKPGANLWWNGWLAGYSAATVVQGVVFVSSDELATRQDMATGAATTLLGAVGQLITPMVPGHASVLLDQIPENTPEERLKKLNNAEELLKASALREKSGRSWQMHAVSGVVNLSSGLITWLGFKRSVWAGVSNFALNTVITEAQIWTQPTRAMKDYENYCNKYYPGMTPYSSRNGTGWFVTVYPGGLNMKVVF